MSSYVPLGFSFASGSYNTVNSAETARVEVRPVPVAPAGAYEWQFSRLGLSGFLVDYY
ncbi:MAG: hypothetical protein ACREPM_06305 [Gemmatimonadaceae bacterium]